MRLSFWASRWTVLDGSCDGSSDGSSSGDFALVEDDELPW